VAESTDDYLAKCKIWAANPRVHPLPKFQALPPFKSKKFDTYDEYNAWKREYLMEIARNGGEQWLKDLKALGVYYIPKQMEEIFENAHPET
jgi:hypothetical protein